MNASITAADLFEQMRERLGLQWIGGQQGESRVLEAVDTVARRPSLAGYLNTIYPNKVQILGTEELSWLDSLDSRQRWEIIERLMRYRPLRSGERRVGKECVRTCRSRGAPYP